jgi:pyruvate dehydrogenase E2 component (dihydrolipoamide acetyltransferase)
MTEFTLPELGENVTDGDVLRVLVKPGDTLVKDQPVLELETDKATIEVPSSVAGRVKDVNVKEGDKVKVGQTILSVDENGAPVEKRASEQEQKPVSAESRAQEAPGQASATAAGANAAAGIPEDAPGLEQHVEIPKRSTPDRAGAVEERSAQGGNKVVDINRGSRQSSEPSPAPEVPPAPASPSVRRLARELGVDVGQVAGSGPAGRITVDDVKAHAKRIVSGSGAAGNPVAPSEPLPDFSQWGDVERQPMRPVRRKTAEHVSHAWATIPHVTQHDLADITALEELRKRYGQQAESAGGSLTVTAVSTKVVASALRVFPQFNASIDLAANEIILKKYINVGIAVDTDRGLLVPVIRNADTKSIIQISVDLAQLSEKARARKISLEEMQGGTFSISNLGGIGGTFFTPIVNAPEVAILGISRARMEPVYDKDRGKFAARLMLPLSLSYDHRVIDGADGIRFLRWVAEALEQPFLLALQG